MIQLAHSNNDDNSERKFLNNLKAKFTVTVNEKADWLLGMSIERTENYIKVNQSKYISQIINKTRLMNGKSCKTPAVDEEEDKEQIPTDVLEYQKLVGSLVYASVITRPDISFAVGRAGRSVANPTVYNRTSVKHIFRYLIHTKDYGLIYSKNGNSELIGYSDADFAGNRITRRSTSGWVFLLAGAAISWSSKRQVITAISTMESEYMALCGATEEVIALGTIMMELEMDCDEPTTIYVDNNAAIKVGENAFSNKRGKHRNSIPLHTREN